MLVDEVWALFSSLFGNMSAQFKQCPFCDVWIEKISGCQWIAGNAAESRAVAVLARARNRLDFDTGLLAFDLESSGHLLQPHQLVLVKLGRG